MPPADRISALDLSNLRVEARGLPMHITALALLDGRPSYDVARHVEERTRGVSRLRQVLVGRAWRDDPAFSVARHVRASAIPSPGDETTLLRVCAELAAPPLDRSRPLWDLWVLDGLADGRVALLLRLHHVVADGIGALGLLSALFDPAVVVPPSPPVAPRRAQLASLWAAARLGRAPALSWNRPVGPSRVHHLVRADLARARAVAHEHGGKVNDVVLAAVSGGAHRLLAGRGELTPDLEMHVSVAASIRRPGETGGNRVGVRMVAVPVGEPDAVRRLSTIAARTSGQRRLPPLQPGGRLAQRWMVGVMDRQRRVNLILSNLPGPPVPLCFAGAQVAEMFQLSTLQGNCAIGAGVLSYAGRLNADVVADPEIVPDAEVFARGVAEALEQLGAG